MRSKARALAIAQAGYPKLVFIQETGKLPLNFVFHPMCPAVSTRVEEKSCGLAILMRQEAGLQPLEEHLSPNNWAIILMVRSDTLTLQQINVYLKS